MCKRLICLIFAVAVFIPAQIVSADLIGHWMLDGDGMDASGNGLNGTVNGNVVPTSDRAGNPDSAMQFGGAATDNIDIGDPPALQLTGAMTLAAWVMLDSTNTNNGRIFAKAGGSGARSWSLNIEASSGGVSNPATFQISATGASNISISDSDPLPTDEWVHVAGVYRPGEATEIYVNGQLKASNTTGIPTGQFSNNGRSVLIGSRNNCNNCGWVGSIDDVRIYDQAMSEVGIMAIMAGEPQLYAYRPDPPDGAIHMATWASLSWRPGDSAVSHDVYLGESFDDVNDGTGDTFKANQTDVTYLVGFVGFPYPDGLTPGTTYFWRIDEVNDADPNSPWKGDIWSFTVPPIKAYEPIPADGAEYVGTEGTTFSWTGGMNSLLHSVYFGDSFDEVNNASGEKLQTMATYDPGTLESDKTYYWRVDEFDGSNTIKGDVWSFSTVPTLPVIDPSLLGWWKLDEGQGLTAVDWSGHGNHGTLIGNPQWVDGYDGGALDFEYANSNDGVAVKAFDVATGGITLGAWVRPESFSQNDGRIITKASGTNENDHVWMLSTIASGSDYVLRFRLKTDDGQNTTTLIATSGGLSVDQWTYAAATWDGANMIIYKDGVEVGRDVKGGTAVATNPNIAIAIGNHLTGTAGSRAWDGLIDDVRVYNKALTVAELEQAMRGDTARACDPSPSPGSTTDIVSALPLRWSVGDNATRHDVYFGTDRDDVANADASDTTGIYRSQQAATSFSPAGVVMGGGPYYWRVDEVASDGTITAGTIWSFSVADYIIVEDFESYNDIPAGEPGSNLVYVAWIDGFDNPNSNGSTIGYVTGASMESSQTHSGRLSAPMAYNNTTAGLSEVTRNLSPAQDWTANGVTTLTLWFYGDTANTSGQLYVKINGIQVNYDGDAGDLSEAQWHRWNLDLTKVGTNLQSVSSLAVGVQGVGAIGTLLLDDIALYR